MVEYDETLSKQRHAVKDYFPFLRLLPHSTRRHVTGNSRGRSARDGPADSRLESFLFAIFAFESPGECQ